MSNIKERKLKSLRVEYGYTQEEIAEKIGKTKQTYGEYEKNPSKMRLETILELRKILGDRVISILLERKGE